MTMLHGLTAFVPALTLYDNLEFLIRIVLAALLGMTIGIERARRQKEAGTRTHCIIAATAAALMILSKYAFGDVGDGNGARIAAQVVSGISFLGAGVIFRSGRYSIQGLTTAAGIWGTAAVGMAIGAGMYWLGLILAGGLVIIQILLHRLSVGDSAVIQEMTVRMRDEDEEKMVFDELLRTHGAVVLESSLTREDACIKMELTARLEEPVTHDEIFKLLTSCSGITHISVQ